MVRLLDINTEILTVLIISLAFCSCHSLNNYDYKHIECQEIPQEAVDIAIADYTKRLKKQKVFDNVVAVHMRVHITTTDWFYISMIPWQLNKDDDSGKCYLTDKFMVKWLDENIGKIPPDWIPSNYIEKNGILYVWHDPKAVLTENLKNVLIKYGLVYYPGDEMIVSTGGGYISYIFCKTNYKKRFYKRIQASYITPLPSCSCSKHTH